jgi:hypothetical protein
MRSYRCRVCHGTFEAASLKGRLPRTCPEHRLEAKRRVDRDKHRENYANGGPQPKPPCCAESGDTQCPQHKLWADFRRKARPLPKRPADDETVSLLLGLIGAVGADGYSIV